MTNNANMHANYYSKNNNEIQKKLVSNRSSSVINSKKTRPKILPNFMAVSSAASD